MATEIHLRIVLQQSIEFLMYALQRGKGAAFQTVQVRKGNGSDLIFDFTVEARQAKDSSFSIAGPFVQGTPDNRFVYINLGSYAGQSGAAWNGRIKVPLPKSMSDQSSMECGSYRLCCFIPGRTNEGKPVLATVKPFAGWFREEL